MDDIEAKEKEVSLLCDGITLISEALGRANQTNAELLRRIDALVHDQNAATIAALERVRDSGPEVSVSIVPLTDLGRTLRFRDNVWCDHINAEINKLREQGK